MSLRDGLQPVPGVSPLPVSPVQREQLLQWSRGGATPFRLVVRARIVLLASFGYSSRKIARLVRVSPVTVHRWRSRFELLGLEGIRREAPRSGSPPPLSRELVQRVLEISLWERPVGRRHWSTRSLAKEVGVSHSTVRRIWKMYGIRPQSSRVKILAEHSPYLPMQVDLAGVYVNPPQRAVIFSVRPVGPSPEETVGGPSPRKGPLPAAVDKRDWMKDLVTTLAALDRPTGPPTRHRNLDREFLTFLRAVTEHRLGKDRIVLVAESPPPSSSPQISRWLDRHPELTARLVEKSEPLAEGVSRAIGASPGVTPAAAYSLSNLARLQSAVDRWKRDSQASARPFAWKPE